MVTAYIPLRERDIVVGDLEIRIRPIHDEAFANDLAWWTEAARMQRSRKPPPY